MVAGGVSHARPSAPSSDAPRLVEARWPAVSVTDVQVSPNGPAWSCRRQRVVATIHLRALLPVVAHVVTLFDREGPTAAPPLSAPCTLHSFKSLANGTYGFEGVLPDVLGDDMDEHNNAVRDSARQREEARAAPTRIVFRLEVVASAEGR